jgi:sorbitol-6-phosphate 2-dehydrogenase
MNSELIAAIAPAIRGATIPRDANGAAAGRPAFVSLIDGSLDRSGEGILEAEIDATDSGSMARSIGDSMAAWKSSRADPDALPSAFKARSGGEAPAFAIGRDRDDAFAKIASGEFPPWIPDRPAPAVPGSAAARSGVVEGKIALVTGGAQGFGEQIVRGLCASGATVFVADLNLEGARRLCGRVNAESGRLISIPLEMDVADESSVAGGFGLIQRTSGGIDLAVSNAGTLKAGGVLEQSLADFRLVAEVNYVAFFLIAKYSGLLMRAQASTAPGYLTDIVQVNSKSGLQGSNRNGAYAGSKFGGIGLVQSFALELIGQGTKVNAICPGNFYDGPLWSDPDKGLFVQYLRAGKVPGAKTLADVRAHYEAKSPIHRGCSGPDVMRALFYVVEQEFETGQAVPVTGGQVMLN